MDIDPQLKIQLLENDLEIKESKIMLLNQSLEQANNQIAQIKDEFSQFQQAVEVEYQQKISKSEWATEERIEEYQQLLEETQATFQKKLDSKKSKITSQKKEISKLKGDQKTLTGELEGRIEDIWKLGEELKSMDDKLTKQLNKYILFLILDLNSNFQE